MPPRFWNLTAVVVYRYAVLLARADPFLFSERENGGKFHGAAPTLTDGEEGAGL